LTGTKDPWFEDDSRYRRTIASFLDWWIFDRDQGSAMTGWLPISGASGEASAARVHVLPLAAAVRGIQWCLMRQAHSMYLYELFRTASYELFRTASKKSDLRCIDSRWLGIVLSDNWICSNWICSKKLGTAQCYFRKDHLK